VLLHDPFAVFRFKEHDVFIPMMVLEELDAAKKGVSDLARAARQVSRNLEDILNDSDRAAIERGLSLPKIDFSSADNNPGGRLFLQTTAPEAPPVIDAMPGNTPDNSILAATLSTAALFPAREVILVSKDINLRIKARILGITAEDYYNDKTLDDVELLYTGMRGLDAHHWAKAIKAAADRAQSDSTVYRLDDDGLGELFPNECVHTLDEKNETIVRTSTDARQRFEPSKNYRDERSSVWGIRARNLEQNFALNLLMDPDIDFVSLIGVAGTGKTLLALAAGLSQTMETKHYQEIIMTRETVPVGEDIGFLPGTEEEKMTPWMGALLDNLEVLTHTTEGGGWGRDATSDLLHNRIKIRSLSFMRGRTFLNRYIIIDEAQNLTVKQIRTLITRAGPGSKIVCLGNIGQIDSPYLSETTSGLTYAVDRFRSWKHSGHVTLTRGERSRLADFATNNL
jgi:PhoH-like ATPase